MANSTSWGILFAWILIERRDEAHLAMVSLFRPRHLCHLPPPVLALQQ